MTNTNFEIENNTAILKINPKVYNLDVVYSAAYVFLDKAYVLLDGDPKTEIIVKLIPKESGVKISAENCAKEFFNELVNYEDYSRRAKETKTIREAILQRALVANDPSILTSFDEKEDEEFEKLLKELEEDDEEIDDPEGIAIPWEEKYGKNAKKNLKSSKKAKKVSKTKKKK